MLPVTCYKGQRHLSMPQPLQNTVLNPDHIRGTRHQLASGIHYCLTATYRYGMYTNHIWPNLLLRVPVREGDEEVRLISSFFCSDAVSVLRGEISLTREHSWRSEFTNTTTTPSTSPHHPNSTVPPPTSARHHTPLPLMLYGGR